MTTTQSPLQRLTPLDARDLSFLKGTFSRPVPADSLKPYVPINDQEDDLRWRKLNDFALRSFRDTADLDYICARIACKHQIVPQFLWSSLQAIEKYLKCILFLNRIPAKRLRHNVVAALEKVETQLPFSIDLQDELIEFIKMVDEQGPLRYFEAPYLVLRNELRTLDWTIWRLRQYAPPMNYLMGPAGSKIDMLPIELDRIRRAQRSHHNSFRSMACLRAS